MRGSPFICCFYCIGSWTRGHGVPIERGRYCVSQYPRSDWSIERGTWTWYRAVGTVPLPSLCCRIPWMIWRFSVPAIFHFDQFCNCNFGQFIVFSTVAFTPQHGTTSIDPHYYTQTHQTYKLLYSIVQPQSASQNVTTILLGPQHRNVSINVKTIDGTVSTATRIPCCPNLVNCVTTNIYNPQKAGTTPINSVTTHTTR